MNYTEETHADIPRPEELFHYTSAAGLLGIVQSNELWATHMSFLNDSTERLHGASILDEIIHEREKNSNDPDLSNALAALGATGTVAGAPAYVFCLTTKGNDLSQWRAYASRGGYAVGFASQAVCELTYMSDMPVPNLLTPVIYDDTRKRNQLVKLLDGVLAELKRAADDKKLVDHAFGNWSWALHYHFSTFKQESFSAEDEWRFVCQLEAAVRFRSSGPLLIPYQALRLLKGQKLPITSVTLGPRAEPHRSLAAVSLLMKKHGYPNVAVKDSGIPLRDNSVG